jgi:hypothetical protein
MAMRRLGAQLGARVPRSVRQLSTGAVQEKKKMNLFTALNDGMKVAMQTDPSAILFGEGMFV